MPAGFSHVSNSLTHLSLQVTWTLLLPLLPPSFHYSNAAPPCLASLVLQAAEDKMLKRMQSKEDRDRKKVGSEYAFVCCCPVLPGVGIPSPVSLLGIPIQPWQSTKFEVTICRKHWYGTVALASG